MWCALTIIIKALSTVISEFGVQYGGAILSVIHIDTVLAGPALTLAIESVT